MPVQQRRGVRSSRGLAPIGAGAGARVGAGVAVAVAGALVAVAVWLAPGGAGLATEPVHASIEEGSGMAIANIEVRDIEVVGPAAGPGAPGLESGSPNRVGSAAVPVRSYTPEGEAWATLVWAHGGSFMRGTLDWAEADWASRRFAEAGMLVYSVDYALASSTVKAPAPGNDLAAVLAWAAANGEGPLVVGGASAGAHLAVLAALAQADLAAVGEGRAVDALILEYPTLHRVQREDAALAAATAVLPDQRRFDAVRIAEMYDFYLGDAAQAAAVGAVVAGELPAERLALLPATVIVNADADDLRASGEEFAEQLRAAGVAVTASVQPGTVHGYLNRPEESERAEADARETIARFVEGLRAVLAV